MIELLSYPFFQRALAAAFLVSIACGLVGTYIVSRKIVFLGGSISHASFGGIGIGYYLGINPLAGATIFAMLSAFSIEYLTRRTKMRTDTLIGILWSFGMAVGIIFIYITPGYAPNLMGYLFGSILTVSLSDLAVTGTVTLLISATFIFLYRDILYVAFDEEFAMTRGIPVRFINYLMFGFIALTIVINIRVVGIILVISLLTIPQATAGLFTNNFKKLLWLSTFFAFLSSLSGLVISHYLEIPSGASIIFTSVLIFTGALIFQKAKMAHRRDSSDRIRARP